MNLTNLRAKLDRLNDQIVGRFKDRSWFVLNEAVYTPGAIPIFYISLLPRLCQPGDDPHYYGETTYADADLLARINERMYLGGYMAKFKLEREPMLATIAADADADAVREALRDARREATVIAQARGLAPDLMATFFRWIIDQTIDLEVRFVQQMGKMPGG